MSARPAGRSAGWQSAGLVGAGAVVASLWPVSVYLGMAWLLPLTAAMAAGGVLIWRRPAYGVAMTVALLPFLQLTIGSGLIDKPVKPVVGALIVATAVVAAIRGRFPRNPQALLPLTLAAIGFASVTLLSALMGSDPAAAGSATVYLCLGLLLALSASQLAGSREDLVLILTGAVAGLLLAGVEGIAQHFFSHTGRYGFYSGSSFVIRAQGSFGHPSLFAAYLMLSIPVAAALATARSAPRWLRLLAAGAVAAAVPALLFSYTRGAILGLGAGSLIWLAVVRPRIAAAGVLVALVAGLAVAPSALGHRFTSYKNTDDAALLLRTGAWEGAIGIFSRHPVLGVGLGDFPRAYAAVPADVLPVGNKPLFYRQLRTDAQPWHAHNVYLTILAEEGLIGFIAFALLAAAIMGTILRGTRSTDPIGRAVCLGAGASALAWAVHGMVDFDTYWVSLPLFTFIGIAAAQAGLAPAPAVSPRAMGATGTAARSRRGSPGRAFPSAAA